MGITSAILMDRPVAYHPDLARVLGGVKCAVFMSQLLYWTGKGKRPDGFIWKTQAELEEETGLTRYEQEGARKKLIELGVLDEKRIGIPATLHYRVNLYVLEQLLDEYYRKQDCGKPAICTAENPQSIPENTTENTPHVADATARDSDGNGSPTSVLDSVFGKKQERPKVTPTPHWSKVVSEGWAAWGVESAEMARQIEAFGERSYAVRRLGYKLDKEYGLRPVWSRRKDVKSWMEGLAACLGDAGGDEKIVLRAARELIEAGLTVANPWSLRKKAGALAAGERRKETTGPPIYSDEWYDLQMENNPQLQRR